MSISNSEELVPLVGNNMSNKFAVDTTEIASIESTPSYDHGFTVEEVASIKKAKEAISARQILSVTLQEFKEVIVPWTRIHRTEQFILHPPKEVKTRVAKAPKVPKEKKLSKKALEAKLKKDLEARLDRILAAQIAGDPVSKEDSDFMADHIKRFRV